MAGRPLTEELVWQHNLMAHIGDGVYADLVCKKRGVEKTDGKKEILKHILKHHTLDECMAGSFIPKDGEHKRVMSLGASPDEGEDEPPEEKPPDSPPLSEEEIEALTPDVATGEEEPSGGKSKKKRMGRPPISDEVYKERGLLCPKCGSFRMGPASGKRWRCKDCGKYVIKEPKSPSPPTPPAPPQEEPETTPPTPPEEEPEPPTPPEEEPETTPPPSVIPPTKRIPKRRTPKKRAPKKRAPTGRTPRKKSAKKELKCVECGSTNTQRKGRDRTGKQKYKCKACGRYNTEGRSTKTHRAQHGTKIENLVSELVEIRKYNCSHKHKHILYKDTLKNLDEALKEKDE